jgi:hypothetical protein
MRLTLSLILDHVVDELSTDAASILLLDAATQELEFAQGRGLATTAADHPRLRLGDGHAGKVALERRVVVVPELENSGASRNEVCMNEGFVSYVGAPLVAKGQVKASSRSAAGRASSPIPNGHSSRRWPAKRRSRSTAPSSSKTCSGATSSCRSPTTPRSRAGRGPPMARQGDRGHSQR